ncbi:Retrovirus-related Pol polyprotein from transposon 17.6 [Thelohanellus kitauei]|uniref:Retrovirus-related Pol polyprotein from transposon 17.6 n=1 Tax=Thelohanellus kitauei TaxID=669202 RepID=A0A0C2IAG7_THEKT|nr:Retrovirus-related Pol polyprotein from transposon 17.6 [Thelohanellus kitauei]
MAAVCLKFGKARVVRQKENINTIDSEQSNDNIFDLAYNRVFSYNHSYPCSKINGRYLIVLNINGEKVRMLVNTGASVSCVGPALWRRFGEPKLSRAPILIGYSKNVIGTLGMVKVTVECKNKKEVLSLVITKTSDWPVFGLNWMNKLGINLTLNTLESSDNLHDGKLKHILSKYASIFETNKDGITNHTASIRLTEDAIPLLHRPRRVPLGIKTAVDKELERLVDNGVIERVDPVNEKLIWACPIVNISKKNGGVRICGDFRCTLNRHIIIPPYPFPSFDDVIEKVRGGETFSVLDLKDAYLQLPLDEASKSLACISTHSGYYRYRRLPFGLSSAPMIFQATIDSILQGIPNIACYLDDIIVTGRNHMEHLNNLEEVFKRMSEANINICQAKCQFMKEEVDFLGHKINKNGIHPIESKIESIQKLPFPNNVKELKAFLGSVSYYSRFIPMLHDLTKKGMKWIWGKEHQTLFEHIKNVLSSQLALKHFDEKRPIIVATDASSVGVGAVMLQLNEANEEVPVICFSRTLDSAEQRYSVTEKEALALVFAVKKLHYYLYGRNFTFITDHKPLERLLSGHHGLSLRASARIS